MQFSVLLNRMIRRNRGSDVYAAYTYHPGSYPSEDGIEPNQSRSAQIQKIIDGGKTWECTYDDNGNIPSEKRNNQEAKTLTYIYDALGQLIRANDPTENKTWTYAYDQGGNLLARKTYAHTTGSLDGKTPQSTDTYAYTDNNWKDKLTAYNGKAITYDAIGNPLSDGTWTYAWQRGRQLASMTKSGQTIQYTYNHNGLRVKKTVNGVETHYTLRGKQIVHLKKGTTQMHFYYDGQGKPGLVTYNGSDYYYAYNLQGDVVGLIDPSNQWVVEYRYDPWGKPLACTGSLASTLGVDNPFRYRGYLFDAETGFYYLRSRYYSTVWNRFVNADSTSSLNELTTPLHHKNIYSYCDNNPIARADDEGDVWFAVLSIIAGVVVGYPVASLGAIQVAEWAGVLKLREPEKLYYAGHPGIALKSFYIRDAAINKTVEMFGHKADGSNANAFQHAYWAALLYQNFGEEDAVKIFTNHETWTGSELKGMFEGFSVSDHTDMDMHNNYLGLMYAKQYFESSPQTSLAEYIYQMILREGEWLR